MLCIYLVISNLNNLIGFKRLPVNKNIRQSKDLKYSIMAAKRYFFNETYTIFILSNTY